MNLFSSDISSSDSDAWAALRRNMPCPAGATPAAQALFELYGPIANPVKTPFVVAQLGQSLDGFIATESGASHYINGEESLIHLHRLRALCDAVVVGWRTVEADDPQLTTRHAAGSNPLRVVIDVEGRLSARHRAFSAESPGALRLTGGEGPPLEGVPSEKIRVAQGRADPKAVIALLAERGCKRILIEGGGVLVSDFLAAGVLDRLHLSVAPLLIGEGRRGIALPPALSLKEALRPMSKQYLMGTDVLFDMDLRRQTGH